MERVGGKARARDRGQGLEVRVRVRVRCELGVASRVGVRGRDKYRSNRLRAGTRVKGCRLGAKG